MIVIRNDFIIVMSAYRCAVCVYIGFIHGTLEMDQTHSRIWTNDH